ncbi:hypothetical protein HZB03_04435, partial [Candidatus Woesearchaeota archaeon]|nr:hypothetical protein [Candidatus Woesearchaeota archaeon]
DKVISGTASLKVTLISQDPDPVGPGNFVDVRFKVDNVGSQNAKGVEIQLLPRFPFSLDPGDSGIRNVGSIQGGQAGEEGVIVKYRLRVADDALQARSEIEVKYRHAGLDWQKLEPFLIDVKTPDAVLMVDTVKVDPSPLQPGQEGTLTMNIRNVADSLLRNIKIDLDLTGSSFAPVGSTASAYIGRLESGKSSEVIMKLFADPQASSKAHRLPLRMTYADDSLAIYSKNYTVGILVYDGPSYVLNVEDRTLQAQNKKGKVTVSISNTGSGDMKYVTLEILPSDKYVVLSKDAEYLGNLESDDFETAEFEIYPATNGLLVPIDVSVRYKDSFNKEYADKRQVKLQLYSSAELKKYELTPKQSRVWLVVALFVVLLAAWIAYRRWERKRLRKRQKEAEA